MLTEIFTVLADYINYYYLDTSKSGIMNFSRSLIFIISTLFPLLSIGQSVKGFVHEQSATNGYVFPTDQEVLKKLDSWQDLKFGVIFHFGLYSVPGIVESWSICSEDVDWITREGDLPYDKYKEWYWNLVDSFNPIEFNPERWAEIMKDAGVRYMIFTTKHHDGFCLFPSKFTDFNISKSPFGDNPRYNIAKEVFQAFRDKDFMIGCYFSKPDWHSEWFWNPGFATPGRGINYKKERHPDWWSNYQNFTASQLGELLNGDYGIIDILWLDGGWITGDDIGLDNILSEARSSLHPGLISVDRSIRGKNENYQTPERGIPDRQLLYPWESCIPLSNDWGWVPHAQYKSAEKIIGLLAETTAKGGSLLLGVGPTPQGTIDPEVENRLREIGNWLDTNGEAIYSTRPTPIFNDGNTWFTSSKDDRYLYAIYVIPEGEKIPEFIEWNGNIPSGRMTLLDGNQRLSYKTFPDGKVRVMLPKGIKNSHVTIKFTAAR